MRLKYKGAKAVLFFWFNFSVIYQIATHYKITGYNSFCKFLIDTLSTAPTTVDEVRKRMMLIRLITGKRGPINTINHLINNKLIASISEEITRALSYTPKEKPEETTNTEDINITELLSLAIIKLRITKQDFLSLTPGEFFAALDTANEDKKNELASDFYHHSLTAFAVVRGYNNKIKYEDAFINPYLTTAESPKESEEERKKRNEAFLKRTDKLFNTKK
ncbi:MAG: hypothetical protein PF444_02065 [Bacteroidales bacterium]|jgi:hypothetical protein|nr:hypothetical protein [Bacteroidales bacterium]